MKAVLFSFHKNQVLFSVLLLTVCIIAKAQYHQQSTPSQFDRFISKSEIEWAAYASDTFHFASFNKMLIGRFKNGEIKAALPVHRGVSDQGLIEYVPYDSLNSIVLYPSNICPIFDSSGKMLFDPALLKPYPLDSSKYSESYINQILYIENGILKSYIPWVNVDIINYNTSSGIFLGNGTYLSTCFLLDHNVVVNRKSRIIPLPKTIHKIKFDSLDAENRLKETYGRNLVETLWPYVMKDELKLYAYETGKNIKAADIRYLKKYLQLPVPRFDAEGNKEASDFGNPEVNPSIFKYADIVQEWYYDVTRNIVANYVKELILLGFRDDGEERRYFPVLKLSF